MLYFIFVFMNWIRYRDFRIFQYYVRDGAQQFTVLLDCFCAGWHCEERPYQDSRFLNLVNIYDAWEATTVAVLWQVILCVDRSGGCL